MNDNISFIQPKDAWDALSIPEKAEMMRVAVSHGIYNLNDIRQKYNEFAEGGDKEDEVNTNIYSVGNLVDAIYQNNPREEYLGEPSHHYDFTQSEEWADAQGYYPNARGHRDDRVKKPAHPSHLSRGTWNNDIFALTDIGMENPNYTMFGLTDGGQDPQAVLTYKGGVVLPEVTVTPKGNYFYNPYDNIKLHVKSGGGQLENLFYPKGENLYGFGDWMEKVYNKAKSAVRKGKKIVKDLGLSKSPGQHLVDIATPIPGSALGLFPTVAINTSKKLGVAKFLKGDNKDRRYRQNIYNAIDPTSDVPQDLGSVVGYGLSAIASKFENSTPYYRKYNDAVADAAWAKRLGLEYDHSALIDNGDGTVRLPIELEAEIPTDTLALKERIKDNEKLLNQVYGRKRQLVGLAIDYDKEALDSLRKTYSTGEPVTLDEHSHVNRNWGGLTPEEVVPTPLNTLHRYTVQYDKDNNIMKYWDWYDFNEFEDFVPGKPFKIQGSIDLNNKK